MSSSVEVEMESRDSKCEVKRESFNPLAIRKLSFQDVLRELSISKEEKQTSEKNTFLESNVDFAFVENCDIRFYFLFFTVIITELWMYVLIGFFTPPLKSKIKVDGTMVMAYVFITMVAVAQAAEWQEKILFALRHSIRIRNWFGIFVSVLELFNLCLYYVAFIFSTLSQPSAGQIASNGVGILSISELDEMVYKILSPKALVNIATTESDERVVIDYKSKSFSRLFRYVFWSLVVTFTVVLILLRYAFNAEPASEISDAYDDDWWKDDDYYGNSNPTEFPSGFPTFAPTA